MATYARFAYLWNAFGDIIRIDIDKLPYVITEGKVSGASYDINGIYMDMSVGMWERFRNSQTE